MHSSLVVSSAKLPLLLPDLLCLLPDCLSSTAPANENLNDSRSSCHAAATTAASTVYADVPGAARSSSTARESESTAAKMYSAATTAGEMPEWAYWRSLLVGYILYALCLWGVGALLSFTALLSGAAAGRLLLHAVGCTTLGQERASNM